MTSLLEPSLCIRLALTLLHFLWQGAAIAALAALVALCLRRRLAWTRYTVWLCSLLLMAACPLVTAVVVTRPLSDARPPASATRETASAAALPEEPLPAIDPAPTASVAHPRAYPQERVLPALTSQVPPGDTALPAGGTSPRERLDLLTILLRYWQIYAAHIVACYLAGVALVLARLLLGIIGGQRLRRDSEPLADIPLLAGLVRQARALGLRFVPAVACCRRVAVPTVVGVLRPMILLPLSLTSGMSIEQVEVLLAHELAHIRRYDYLVNILQRLIEAFLFFHPAVWFVSGRIRVERELCCDDRVVRAGCAPLRYADSLLHVAELCHLQNMRPAGAAGLALADHHAELRHRILRLLGVGSPEPLRLARGWPVVLLLIAGLALLAGSLRGRAGAASAAGSSTTQPAASRATASQPTPAAQVDETMRVSEDAIAEVAGGGTIELVALSHTGDSPQWWTPQGKPTELPGVSLSGLSATGYVAAFRVKAQEPEVHASTCKGAYILDMKDFHQVPSSDIWLGVLDYPEGRRFVNIHLSVSSGLWTTLYTLPLTAEKLKDNTPIGKFGIRAIEGFKPVKDGLEIAIVPDGRLTGRRFAALTRDGRTVPQSNPDRNARGIEPLTLDFPVSPEDFAGLARQDRPRATIHIRNASLRAGQPARVMTVADQYDLSMPRRLPSPATRPSSAVVTFPGGGSVELLGLARLVDGQITTWAPDGKTMANPGLLDADMQEGSTLLLWTFRGTYQLLNTFILQGDNRRQLEHDGGAMIRPGLFWTQPMPEMAETRSVDLLFTGYENTLDPSRKVALTADDAGKTREFPERGMTVQNLHATGPAAFELEIEFAGRAERLQFWAVDKTGQTHRDIGRFWGANRTGMTFDFPLEQLAGLIPEGRQPMDGVFHNVSLVPGHQTQVTAEARKTDKAAASRPTVAEGTQRKSAKVLLPDGKPAAGVEVTFGPAPNRGALQVSSGHIGTPPDVQKPVKTGADGQFGIPGDAAIGSFLVWDERGFGLVMASELDETGVIQMRAWGRVEGTLRIGDKPAVMQDVELRYDADGPRPGQGWVIIHFETKTDGDGSFQFTHVPPLDFQIGQSFIIKRLGNGGFRPGTTQSRHVTVEPGATARAELGGLGRPVVGRVTRPEGDERNVDWTDASGRLTLSLPEPPYPSGMVHEEKQNWLKKWRQTDLGRQNLLAQRRYDFKVEPDGSFRLEDIPAGKYDMQITMFPEDSSGSFSEAKREVVIAEDAYRQPQDLGGIVMAVKTRAVRASNRPAAPASRPATARRPAPRPAAPELTSYKVPSIPADSKVNLVFRDMPKEFVDFYSMKGTGSPTIPNPRPAFCKSEFPLLFDLHNSSTPVALLLDESGGTGTGYDTLYADFNDNGDFQDDPVYKAAPAPGETGPDEGPVRAYFRDVQVPRNPQQGTSCHVQVFLEGTQSPPGPTVNLSPHYNLCLMPQRWAVGTVKLGDKTVPAGLIDRNWNDRLTDAGGLNPKEYPNVFPRGDYLAIAVNGEDVLIPGRTFGQGGTAMTVLADYLAVDQSVFMVKAEQTAEGVRLELLPATVTTGKLELNPMLQADRLLMIGTKHCVLLRHPTDGMRVPADTYIAPGNDRLPYTVEPESPDAAR